MLCTEVVICCILNALTLMADLLVNGMCLRCFERFRLIDPSHIAMHVCLCRYFGLYHWQQSYHSFS